MVEEFSLIRHIENSYEKFRMRLLSVGSQYIVWRSFSDAASLRSSYLKSQFNKFNEKNISPNSNWSDYLNFFCDDAVEYRNWLESESRRPILESSIVEYCGAAEEFLKSIAYGFALVKTESMSKKLYVKKNLMRNVRRKINEEWKAAGADRSLFYFKCIYSANPDIERYFLNEKASREWQVVNSSFQLRNAVIHSLGIPSETIEIGDRIFRAGENLNLSGIDLHRIKDALMTVVNPFDPHFGAY